MLFLQQGFCVAAQFGNKDMRLKLDFLKINYSKNAVLGLTVSPKNMFMFNPLPGTCKCDFIWK